MKDFDIEKAKAGHPVCIRDGRSARIICWDRQNDKPIVALVKIYEGENPKDQREEMAAYFESGKLFHAKEDKLDLMMVGVKKEGWCWMKQNPDGSYWAQATVYQTKEKAMKGIDDIVCFSKNHVLHTLSGRKIGSLQTTRHNIPKK